MGMLKVNNLNGHKFNDNFESHEQNWTFYILFESFDNIASCYLKKDVSFVNVDLTTIIRKIDFKKRPGKK